MGERPLGFWRFYGSLITEIPAVLRSTIEAWVFWILTIGVPVLLWVRPSFKPMTDLPEFSRWVVTVPIVISILYGMLRVALPKNHLY